MKRVPQKPSRPAKSKPAGTTAATKATKRTPAASPARASSSSKATAGKPAAGKPSGSKATTSKAAAGKAAAKPAAGKAAARSAAGKAIARPAAGKAAARPGKATGKAAAASEPAVKYTTRADFGAPIAGFFKKQPAPLRTLLEELRDLILECVPDATSSIKWGMPFFTVDGAMMCALGGHKSHINLILPGPPGTYADPENRLGGEAKTGRHLKLTAAEQVPHDAVRGWIATAAKQARAKQ